VNPIELLAQEHRRIVDALGQCVAQDARVRSVVSDLRAHMRLEEDILYPALSRRRGHKAHSAVHRALEQHQRLDGLITGLLDLEPDAADFQGRLAALRAAFEAHVAYEEAAVFQDAAASLPPPRLGKLAAAIAARLGQARSRAQRTLEKT
jgi:hemerythrin superfamily protein